MAVPKLILFENIQALGWAGLTGTAALVIGLAYGAAVLVPAEKEQQRTRLNAVEAESRQAEFIKARNSSGEKPLAPSAASPQDTFYRDFSAQADVTRSIERIYAAATAAKLSLARGEYALVPVTDTRLTRYQISLPLQGDYGQIRRFLASIQVAVPNLSVDDLTLQRQTIGETQVEGHLRLSLYLVKS